MLVFYYFKPEVMDHLGRLNWEETMPIVRTGFSTSGLTVEGSDKVLFPSYAQMNARTTLPSSLTEANELYLDKRELNPLKGPVKSRIKRLVKGKCYYEIKKEVIDILGKSRVPPEFSKTSS